MSTIYEAIKSLLEARSKIAFVGLLGCSAIIVVGHCWPHHFVSFRDEILTAAKAISLLLASLLLVNSVIFLRDKGCAWGRGTWRYLVSDPLKEKGVLKELAKVSIPALAYLAVALSKRKRTFPANADDPAIIELCDRRIIEESEHVGGVFTIVAPAWRAMVSMPEFELPTTGVLDPRALSVLPPQRILQLLPQKHPSIIQCAEKNQRGNL